MKTLSRIILVLLYVTALLSAKEPNALIDESSPYLRQHAYNPVQWMPWGEEAFEKAKKEHKPIFLSIGYSTCHWCHVMEGESFENETIAELFNRYFIPVKVDREEMPHLDIRYQELHRKVKNRSGGWPLSVFLTQEGEPFYITTYIPDVDKYGVEGLATFLPKTAKAYRSDPEKIRRKVKAIAALSAREETADAAADLSSVTLFESLKKRYDALYYGYAIAPKFPEASKTQLLFALGALGNKKATEMALEVLRTMAMRGLYDHSEGGFFRYSVDANWEIPHFEKMLYNQAELIPLYVHAYELTAEPLFKAVAEETIAMVQQRFAYERFFFSASDADSLGEEGGYFIYSDEQLRSALKASGNEAEIKALLEYGEAGNFEGRWHLCFYAQQRPKGYRTFIAALRDFRKGRTYPFIDRKIITAWNAMMVEALFKASVLDEKYALTAKASLAALEKLMGYAQGFYHQTLAGNMPRQEGLLEDYAFIISAYLAAYEATFDEGYLAKAKTLTDVAIKRFYDAPQWYLSADELRVKADTHDKYYTAALGRMLQNIQRLATLGESLELQSVASRSLKALRATLAGKQGDVPSTAIAWLMQEHKIVLLKHEAAVLRTHAKMFRTLDYPFVLLKRDKTAQFEACVLGACFATAEDAAGVKRSIEGLLKDK